MVVLVVTIVVIIVVVFDSIEVKKKINGFIEYTRIRSKNALRPTSPATVAVILRTGSALAGNTVVTY